MKIIRYSGHITTIESTTYLDSKQLKNYEYNQSQYMVGHELRTLNGSKICRCSKYGVGKLIGGDIYFHKDYVKDIIPSDIWESALYILSTNYGSFSYNCIRYSPNLQRISFQASLDFDTAREPMVGNYITIDIPNERIISGSSRYIWHHKWLWVKNDYPGFDVAESWRWSKYWLSVLNEKSDGNGIDRWNAQLDRFDLPRDI